VRLQLLVASIFAGDAHRFTKNRWAKVVFINEVYSFAISPDIKQMNGKMLPTLLI